MTRAVVAPIPAGVWFAEAGVPNAPANPVAVADSDTEITVSWDDVTDETGYRVERSPNGTSGWSDVSGNLAADTTSYQDTGLTADTTYYYRVIAFNAEGDSAPSATASATTSGGSVARKVIRSPRYGITRVASR